MPIEDFITELPDGSLQIKVGETKLLITEQGFQFEGNVEGDMQELQWRFYQNGEHTGTQRQVGNGLSVIAHNHDPAEVRVAGPLGGKISGNLLDVNGQQQECVLLFLGFDPSTGAAAFRAFGRGANMSGEWMYPFLFFTTENGINGRIPTAFVAPNMGPHDRDEIGPFLQWPPVAQGGGNGSDPPPPDPTGVIQTLNVSLVNGSWVPNETQASTIVWKEASGPLEIEVTRNVPGASEPPYVHIWIDTDQGPAFISTQQTQTTVSYPVEPSSSVNVHIGGQNGGSALVKDF